MDRSPRPSGIPNLGDLPWGSHVCQLYRSKEDLLELLVPYFKAGLENNEACIWITSLPLSCAEARTALAAAVPDLDARLAGGQMLIASNQEWYGTAGGFDARRVFSIWDDAIGRSLARGYAGLRVSGDSSWINREQWAEFTAYELRCDDHVSGAEVIALCTYALDRYDTCQVLDAVKSHGFALIRRDGAWEVMENQSRRRALQAAREFRLKYETLSGNVIEGFAYCEVVGSGSGEPMDYLVLEANDAFERLTGMKRQSVLGRRATELGPDLTRYAGDWVSRCAGVALTGVPTHFEQFLPSLGRTISVSAYRPERGYFALVLHETGEPSVDTAVEPDGASRTAGLSAAPLTLPQNG